MRRAAPPVAGKWAPQENWLRLTPASGGQVWCLQGTTDRPAVRGRAHTRPPVFDCAPPDWALHNSKEKKNRPQLAR
jgi:hypothetical protein